MTELSGSASSLYIHFPFCASKCAYCDFFSRPAAKDAHELIGLYLAALAIDIKRQHNSGCFLPLKTIYIGGGTPSLMRVKDIGALLTNIQKTAGIQAGAEITLEANLRDVTKDFLRGIYDAGVTRLSLGVQSFNEQSLKAAQSDNGLGTLDALDWWNGTLSIDLIAGLPHESGTSFLRGLQTAAARAQHISLYALTVEKNTPLDAMIASGQIPFCQDDADLLWLLGRDFLETHGFAQYEVSNFAKNGFECEHNSAYWLLQSYAGAGAGAVGSLFFDWDVREKNTDCCAMRYTIPRGIDAYIASNGTLTAENEFLDKETVMFEYLMMGFRTRKGVCAQTFFKRFGERLEEKIGAEAGVFAAWRQKGLAQKNGTRYALSKEGLLFLNKFLTEI
jgi:oxygen-independent coproporphyrinogen-3 oxidase